MNVLSLHTVLDGVDCSECQEPDWDRMKENVAEC